MLLTFLIATPFLAACFIALMRPRHTRLIEGSAIIASVISLGLALALVPAVLAQGSVRASELFSVDALGAFMLVVIALAGFFASLYSSGYLRAEVAKGIVGPSRVRQFFLLLEFFLFAMSLAVSTISPIVMWISIEATTLSTAFLISFYNKPSATEAAWKYLIINSLGLLLSLLGTLLFLALPASGTGSITWDMLREAASGMHPAAVKVAFIFILVGYGTKVGLVPLHTWKPDAYAKAPTPVVALLAGVLVNVALFAILRFKTVTDTAVGTDFASQLLIFFGLLSVLLSALIIFVQKNYKRLLAYSGIEHAGLIALGFGFGGLGTFAALLHMLYHALVKMLLFFAAGNIFLRYSSTKMKNVTGVLSVLPLSGPIFLGGFIAITGLPPFGLFATEMTILSSGMTAYPWVAGTALFSLAVIFFGFFRHLSGMLFGQVPEDVSRGESRALTQIPMLLLAALIIVLAWDFPTELLDLIHQAAVDLAVKP
jgi:hydrogenase-4 component F